MWFYFLCFPNGSILPLVSIFLNTTHMCPVFSDSGLAELGCRPAAESGAQGQAGSAHAALSFPLVVPEVEVEKLVIQVRPCFSVLRSYVASYFQNVPAPKLEIMVGEVSDVIEGTENVYVQTSPFPLPSLKNHEKQIGIYCCRSL